MEIVWIIVSRGKSISQVVRVRLIFYRQKQWDTFGVGYFYYFVDKKKPNVSKETFFVHFLSSVFSLWRGGGKKTQNPLQFLSSLVHPDIDTRLTNHFFFIKSIPSGLPYICFAYPKLIQFFQKFCAHIRYVENRWLDATVNLITSIA